MRRSRGERSHLTERRRALCAVVEVSTAHLTERRRAPCAALSHLTERRRALCAVVEVTKIDRIAGKSPHPALSRRERGKSPC